mmetsp:Transcript_6689/g.11729  ORF Transcript_6689/g.11729 Transcript_6689/m.11729 type:complete len:121 (-) Transcript_6689:143-505(-)
MSQSIRLFVRSTESDAQTQWLFVDLELSAKGVEMSTEIDRGIAPRHMVKRERRANLGAPSCGQRRRERHAGYGSRLDSRQGKARQGTNDGQTASKSRKSRKLRESREGFRRPLARAGRHI